MASSALDELRAQVDAGRAIAASPTTWDFKFRLLRHLHVSRLLPLLAAAGVSVRWGHYPKASYQESVQAYAAELAALAAQLNEKAAAA